MALELLSQLGALFLARQQFTFTSACDASSSRFTPVSPLNINATMIYCYHALLIVASLKDYSAVLDENPRSSFLFLDYDIPSLTAAPVLVLKYAQCIVCSFLTL